MSGQLASEGVALPPGVQPAVADVAVVVDRADVVARVAAAMPPGMVDGVDARVEPERVAVGCLGVLPGHIDEPGQPPDLGPAHVGVHVDRAVLAVMVQPEQLAVVEPVLLPGARRVSQPTLRLCPHQVLPPPRHCPAVFVKPHQRDRMAGEPTRHTSASAPARRAFMPRSRHHRDAHAGSARRKSAALINSGWRIWLFGLAGVAARRQTPQPAAVAHPNGQPASEPGLTFGRQRLSEPQLNWHRAVPARSMPYRAAGLALSRPGRAGKIAA